MRIGMFADMYLPHVSGVTNHISLYKRALEDAGHEVWLFTWGDSDHDDIEPRVVRSPALPYGDTGWNVSLGLSREARGIIRTLDVAHAHHPFASFLAARSSGAPTVFTNHTRYDLYSDTYAGWIPSAIRHSAIRTYLTWLGSRASLTISPSAEISHWLAGFGVPAERTVVLPNAIDTAPFLSPQSPVTRESLGIAEDAFLLAYVGRIAHEKNIGLLLESFTRAAAADPRLALALIGDGPANDLARTIVSDAGLDDRVRFLGMMPYSEVPGVLAAADAFVTASVSEIYPLVVVEACAAGLPVVGVRSPGVGEIVTDRVSGLLCSEDAAELSDALCALACDDSLHAQLREGALDVAAAHDITESAARLAALYESVVSTT